jgi:hypothetical protein
VTKDVSNAILCSGPVDPEPEPCEYDETLDADDPACVPPVDPCEYDETLDADDPACVPPTQTEVCPSDSPLAGTPVNQVETCYPTTPEVPEVDVCPNLDGVQTAVPEGYELVDGECVVPIEVQPSDLCPNLEGTQSEIPEGYELVDGECVVPIEVQPSDLCPNLEGTQSEIPEGYELVDGECLEVESVVTRPAQPVETVVRGVTLERTQQLPRTGLPLTGLLVAALSALALGGGLLRRSEG